MQILSLELYQYQRLLLNNIQRIKITPESKVHLILGTNGSGKSALIKEMSPLPANKKDFGSKGYKKIIIKKGSSLYELTSDFSGLEHVFSFIKDGEELNPGHKSTDYKKLVFNEFNITQDIQELLTGRIKFTQMSTSERRTWFTRISDADYTYALQYYKRLTEVYRDVSGAKKLQQARLVQEKNKLITPEVESTLRKEIDELTYLCEQLLEMRGQATEVKGSVTEYLGSIDLEIEKSIQLYRQLVKRYQVYTHLYSEEELDKAILHTHAELHSRHTMISQMYDDIGKQQQMLDRVTAAGVEPTQNVDSNINSYNEQISLIKKGIVLPISFENAYLALQSVNSISETVISLFNSLQEDPNSLITRLSYETKVQKHLSIQEALRIYNTKFDALHQRKRELEHLKSHNQIECPSCKHVWIQGYSDKQYDEVLKGISSISQEIENQTQELHEVAKHIEHEHDYLKTLSSVAQLIQTWSILKPFWEYINGRSMIRISPKSVLQAFNDLKWDLENYVKIDEIKLKLHKAKELKELMIKDHQSSVQVLIEDFERHQLSLVEKQKELQKTKSKLDILNGYKSTLKGIKELSSKLEDLLKNRENRISVAFQQLNRVYYSDIIQAIQLEISDKRNTIGKVDIQKALIKDIEFQISELDKTSEVLKIAVKELSPNEGLIAKGLTGFINHFVHQLNVFIKKVWLYPLEIVPILHDANEGVDLDYRFSMKVGDQGFIVPDIKDGSEAQKKIIDLAFVVVAMKYLNLEQAPLFLDEFASSMDHAHRESAFHLVSNLANTSNFSQIFMISHFENSYSSLVNSDVTVLCPHNIVIPKNMTYNQHTLIE